MSDILTVEKLKKCYKNVLAVDDISFSVASGSLFAFLGVNGAGKSTTINIICSILAKDGGKIIVDGYDLDREADKIKPLIGIVFQSTVLDALLTVKENLTVRAAFYGLKGEVWKKRLAELTELLSLGDILNRPFGKLSGGQKRRADIARGLVNRPKLLILDEPTTGLDPQTRRTVWGIIEELRKKEGMTVFLTTHYMEEADIADNVVIIDAGKIVAEGTPRELKNKYSASRLYLYGHTAAVDTAEDARAFINKHKQLTGDFEYIKGNMDDVFLSVTGKRLAGGGL